jgi:hypothetical protein
MVSLCRKRASFWSWLQLDCCWFSGRCCVNWWGQVSRPGDRKHHVCVASSIIANLSLFFFFFFFFFLLFLVLLHIWLLLFISFLFVLISPQRPHLPHIYAGFSHYNFAHILQPLVVICRLCSPFSHYFYTVSSPATLPLHLTTSISI